jgi:hypothetical protein
MIGKWSNELFAFLLQYIRDSLAFFSAFELRLLQGLSAADGMAKQGLHRNGCDVGGNSDDSDGGGGSIQRRYDTLVTVMAHLMNVRSNSLRIEGMFKPLNGAVALLQKYGVKVLVICILGICEVYTASPSVGVR